MTHKYDSIVENLRKVFDEMAALGLLDVLAKGGVGEIILANHLGHDLVANDKGADGLGADNKKYEYKVSVTDQFNFHFGTRISQSGETPSDKVKRHFNGLSGSFCALRHGTKIKKLIFVPTDELVSNLCDHFNSTTGQQLNKNYNFAKLKTLPNVNIIID
jgi:hypothetical protein